jgi:hypothetical protein
VTWDHDPNSSELNPKLDVTLDLFWYSPDNMIIASQGPSMLSTDGIPDNEWATDHGKGY